MKRLNPFSFHRHFSFECPGSIDTAIYLLAKFVAKPAWQVALSSRLIGNISTDKIEIWLNRPDNNPFIPVFSGMFINDKGKTVLTGDFRFPKNIRNAIAFGLVAIIAFWIYKAVADQKLSVMVSLWFCLANILFVVVIMYLYRLVSIKNMEWMEQQIRKILTDGSI